MAEQTWSEYVMRNHKLLHDNRDKFHAVFGVSLHKFWSTLTGFDVVKFDEWLGTPDGTSTRDCIANRYGWDAVKLVESLL